MKLKTIISFLEGFTEWVGKICSWFSLFIMGITFTVVVMRYGFETGELKLFGLAASSIALQESVMYLHAMLFMLASAYTLKHNGHVRVDVFYRRFSAKTKALIDGLGSLLLLIPVAAFIAWSSLDFVTFSWQIRETSQEAEGLPWVWLLKALIPAMSALLIFQGLLEASKNFLFLAGLLPDPNRESFEDAL